MIPEFNQKRDPGNKIPTHYSKHDSKNGISKQNYKTESQNRLLKQYTEIIFGNRSPKQDTQTGFQRGFQNKLPKYNLKLSHTGTQQGNIKTRFRQKQGPQNGVRNHDARTRIQKNGTGFLKTLSSRGIRNLQNRAYKTVNLLELASHRSPTKYKYSGFGNEVRE